MPVPQKSDRDNPGGFVHIPALDGVRGIAILLVLFDHLFWSNDKTGNKVFDFISAIRDSSYVGVDLFFALSGFLITGILLDTLDAPHYFKTFYARRALRIFPLYYGFLLLLFCLTPLLHLKWSGWQYLFFTYTANLVPGRWQHTPLHLRFFNIDQFWSLQVEEQFYWLWPLLVYRLRNARSVARASLIGCGVVFGVRLFCVLMKHHSGFADPYLPYSFTPCCADNLLYGCCLAALMRSPWRNRVLRLAPYLFCAALIVLGVLGALNGGLDWMKPTRAAFLIATVGFSFVGIGSAGTVALALRPGSAATRLFQSRILRFMGEYSYGIYVFHYSVGFVMAPVRSFIDTQLHVKALGVLCGAVVAALLSIALAWLSYRFYERPFLRLKRFFSYSGAT